MKKSILAVMMAGTLVFATAPAMFAAEAATEAETEAKGKDSLSSTLSGLFGDGGELSGLLGEDGALSSLLGEGGPVNQYLPEGLNVDALLGTLGDQLSNDDSELYKALDTVTGEGGDLNLGDLGGLLGGLFGAGDESAATEGDQGTFSDLGMSTEEAIKAYIIAEEAGMLEAGDVEEVIPTIVATEEQEDETLKVLGYFLHENYGLDGSDLVLLGASGVPRLLTHAKDENDAWSVTDCVEAEDGEGYAASVAAMAEEVGLTADEFFVATSYADLNDLAAAGLILASTSGAERIEYAGEMYSAEELEKKAEAYIEEIFAQMMGGSAENTTEATTEAVTEAATEAVTEAATE